MSSTKVQETKTATAKKAKPAKAKPEKVIDEAKAKEAKEKRKLIDAKYYKEVKGVKVPCELCGRVVTRDGMKKHQNKEVCKRLAKARQEDLIETETVSPTTEFEIEEPSYSRPLIATKEDIEQMWGEVKEPNFNFEQ